jgi:hypothetical protein
MSTGPSLSQSSRRRQQGVAGAVGIAAAVVVAVLLNVLSARHFRRWDWTSQGLYTLSNTTKQTLSALGEPVQVHVLLPASDPMLLTLRHLLDAYRSLSPRLRVRFVDPDRNPAEFLALQQKYGIVAGKTEDGQLVADAALVVVRGERRHFITAGELIQVETGQEMRARPRVEQVLTAALQQVSRGDALRVCFSSGHGEPSIESGGNAGLMALRRRLEKSNYRVQELPPARSLRGKDPLGDCRLVVVAAPQQAMPKADLRRLMAYLDKGGNMLIASGPVPNDAGDGYLDLGLGPLVQRAGAVVRSDFVLERDENKRAGEGLGEIFAVSLKPHPITDGLIAAEGALPVVLTIASSLEPTPGKKLKALLQSSGQSFGMQGFLTWAAQDIKALPQPASDDAKGPLTLAHAYEANVALGGAERPARMVVIATGSVLYGGNWSNPQLQGTRLFVEAAVSWLASRQIVVDVPRKDARVVGRRITAAMLQGTLLKAVVLIPLFAFLMGLGIQLRRKQTEGRSRDERDRKASPSGKKTDSSEADSDEAAQETSMDPADEDRACAAATETKAVDGDTEEGL